MYLGQVFNKVGLMKYKNYKHFWIDVGSAINNFKAVYNNPESDLVHIGETVKEAATFLYLQWYYLSMKRFIKLKKELS